MSDELNKVIFQQRPRGNTIVGTTQTPEQCLKRHQLQDPERLRRAALEAGEHTRRVRARGLGVDQEEVAAVVVSLVKAPRAHRARLIAADQAGVPMPNNRRQATLTTRAKTVTLQSVAQRDSVFPVHASPPRRDLCLHRHQQRSPVRVVEIVLDNNRQGPGGRGGVFIRVGGVAAGSDEMVLPGHALSFGLEPQKEVMLGAVYFPWVIEFSHYAWDNF